MSLFSESHAAHDQCMVRIRNYIYHDGYSEPLQQLFCNIVNSIIVISSLLYPCSNLLRNSVAKQVQDTAKTLRMNIRQIETQFKQGLEQIDRAQDALQAWCESACDEHLSWTILTGGSPLPHGAEALLFEAMAELFDTIVFHPLIHLHEEQPAHNMWYLEKLFASLSVTIQNMVRSARMLDTAIADLHDIYHTVVKGSTIKMSSSRQSSKRTQALGIDTPQQSDHEHPPDRNAPLSWPWAGRNNTSAPDDARSSHMSQLSDPFRIYSDEPLEMQLPQHTSSTSLPTVLFRDSRIVERKVSKYSL